MSKVPKTPVNTNPQARKPFGVKPTTFPVPRTKVGKAENIANSAQSNRNVVIQKGYFEPENEDL